VWPAIFLGAFLVNLTTAGLHGTSIGIAVGNTARGHGGAFLVNRFAAGLASFERARDVFRFAGLAAVLATAISATVGVTVLALAGYAEWESFDPSGSRGGWAMRWVRSSSRRWSCCGRPRRGSPCLESAWTRHCSRSSPSSPSRSRASPPGIARISACLPLPPPLAWIALRFGPREVATAIALLAAIAVVATEKGWGPFVMSTRNESLLVLQTFMAMVAMTMLPMAALVREHRRP
jgi:integral membrane sensor domain MASE1